MKAKKTGVQQLVLQEIMMQRWMMMMNFSRVHVPVLLLIHLVLHKKQNKCNIILFSCSSSHFPKHVNSQFSFDFLFCILSQSSLSSYYFKLNGDCKSFVLVITCYIYVHTYMRTTLIQKIKTSQKINRYFFFMTSQDREPKSTLQSIRGIKEKWWLYNLKL